MDDQKELHNPWLLEDAIVLHPGLGRDDISTHKDTAETDTLCSRCTAAVRGSKIISELSSQHVHTSREESELVEKFDHSDSVSDVSISAAHGCHLCSILVASLIWRGRIGNIKRLLNERSLSLPDFTNKRQTTINIRRTIEGHSESGNLEEVRIFLDVKDIFRPTDPWHPLEPLHSNLEVVPMSKPRPPTVALCFSTASNTMYTLANTWLYQCMKEHPSCRALLSKTAKSQLPKRLIYVGEGSNATLSPRLVETCQLSHSVQTVSYSALSHRWGYDSILKLTKSNIETWKKGIPHSQLPRTFQHAMIVTRGLKLSFLWIDAMCIIQDSETDLKEEIQRMGTIYMCSKVTIAALAAFSSADGLFTHRNPLALYPLSVRAAHDSQVIIQPPNIDLEELNHDLSFNSREDAPLLDRGWVFQERVLSPRTLFYGRQGLYWECRESHASDFNTKFEPEGWAQDNGLFPHFKGIFVTLLNMLNRGEDIHDHAQQAWMDMVSFFTSRSLGYTRDRRRALLGIAERLQNMTGGHYFHGIFKSSGLDDLNWMRENPRIPLQYSQDGPTWSWESYTGEIRFVSKYGHKNKYVWNNGFFEPFKRSYSLEQPTADESKGRLSITTTLVKMAWQATQNSLNPYQIWPAQPYQGTSRYSNSIDCSIPKDIDVWWLSLGYWGGQTLPNIRKQDDLSPREDLSECGLLVCPKDRSRNEWVRIGFLELKIERDYIGHPRNALKTTIHLI